MKTLVVCLDGTNQTKEQQHPSNIALLFDALGGVATDAGNGSFEATQGGSAGIMSKYLPGVGTQGSLILKILGNGFGDGIAELIVRGYTFLSRNYEPGDAIYITGFSRGAAAARALAGFVAVQGLLNPANYSPQDKDASYLRAVAAWYLYRGGRPDLADPARLHLIFDFVDKPKPQLTPADFVSIDAIQGVGVFDTVSSLGVPRLDSSGRPVFDFSICDTQLNPKIQSGFHAVAADETRDLFSPTFWASRKGIVQAIFPGMHSDVGGGFPHRGLSDGAMDWMITQLAGSGLVFDRDRIGLQPDPFAPAQDDAITFPFNATPRSTRVMPDSVDLSDTLKQRWKKAVETIPVAGTAPYAPRATYADGSPLFKTSNINLKASAQSFA